MARVINFEGRRISVPDDATDAEVASIVESSVSPAPTAQPAPQPAPEKSFLEKINYGNPLPGLRDLAQGAAQVATSIPAQAAGGLRGLAGLAMGDTAEQAAQKIQETSDALTYKPRNEGGSIVARIMGLPIEAGSKVGEVAGGYIGEKLGNRAAGEAIGGSVAPVAATLLGGAGALKGVQGKGVAVAERNQQIAEQLAAEKQRNATIDETRNRVQSAGYVTPAESGVKGQIYKMTKGDQRLSIRNQEVATQNAAREIGLPKNTALSEESIATRQAELNKPYENVIKAAGTKEMVTPPEMTAQLEGMLKDIRAKVEYDPEAFKPLNSVVPLIEQQLTKTVHDPKMLMEQVKELRSQARQAEKRIDKGSSSPNDAVVARTNRGIADMLESVFEYNLADRPKLMERFREARAEKAKAHFVEQVYNESTGKIDLPKVVQYGKDAPLSGGLKTMYDFANAYPQAASKVRGASPALSMMDAMFASGAFVSGHPLLAAGSIATRFTIPTLAERGKFSTTTPKYELPVGRRVKESLFSTPISQLGKPVNPKTLRESLGYDNAQGMLTGNKP